MVVSYNVEILHEEQMFQPPFPPLRFVQQNRFFLIFLKEIHLILVERLRSMTIDSSISYSESRIGGFDVHSNNGGFMGEEINLYHDEVAYTRPIQALDNASFSFSAITTLLYNIRLLPYINCFCKEVNVCCITASRFLRKKTTHLYLLFPARY
uniref:Uncharacterized protein n=1 Tax=Angiostrongylus cantonensis TaxID=6313 RepID=A0A0K0D5I0_ANGCA